MNSWERMSLQSKANYSGDSLATQNWTWPQETWFQKRLAQMRKKRRQTAVEPPQTQMFCASQSVHVSGWS